MFEETKADVVTSTRVILTLTQKIDPILKPDVIVSHARNFNISYPHIYILRLMHPPTTLTTATLPS